MQWKPRNGISICPLPRSNGCSPQPTARGARRSPPIASLPPPFEQAPPPELHEQLTFNTSSSKKRRITRQAKREHDPDNNGQPPQDQALPSTEEDADPSSFSFSADGLNTPTYLRGDSLPASGVPPRLQTTVSSFSATDYTSSAASSPCAESADLSVDHEPIREPLDTNLTIQQPPASAPAPAAGSARRRQSPYVNTTRRALMGGAADLPQRSSSPLKRRASSMEPDQDQADVKEDVDMLSASGSHTMGEESSQETLQGGPSPPVSPAGNVTELPLRNDIPPLDQQVKAIETLVKAFAETPVQEGDVAYLVSRQWLGKAQAFGAGGAKHASKEPVAGSFGPVDNSDIIQAIFTDATGRQCVKLRPGIGSEHFELFPKEAWDLLLSWYGLAAGQVPVIRQAHNTAPDAVSLPNIQFEFHPPLFTVHRLWSATSPIPIEQGLKQSNPAPPVIVQGASSPYHGFLKEAKQLAGVPLDRKVRVWRILQTLPTTGPATAAPASGMKTPPDSPPRTSEEEISTVPPLAPGAWPEMLVDVDSFLKLERDVERALVDSDDTTANTNYNGRKSLSLVGLTVDAALVLDETIDKDSHVSTYRGGVAKEKTLLATKGSSSSLAAQTRATTSGRSSPYLQGPLTRGRAQQKSGRTIGCCGLQNLGNTCYMNSALQCVRSVEELTKYFLAREAEKEINPDNPLSYNGDVATAYGRLLEEIYKDPPPNSVQPRHFKSVIGRYAPAFSGFGQQDSQEFLGFLLDGLQEDLNRIKKKPYIEKPDSTDDMIGNPAAIREMAEKVWDITKKRDDSVIADLFTGMYKSTLVCPVCNKVSITFDPFNNLTLPLPIANGWTRSIKYFPLNDAPVDIVVDIDKNSSMRTMKQYISARVGVPLERLFGGEEFRDRFFKYYDDMACVGEEIQPNDVPSVYELESCPTNIFELKKPKKQQQQQRYRSLLADAEQDDGPAFDAAAAERFLVPVVHRMDPEESAARKPRNYPRKQANNAGEVPPPHFIVLTAEEARSEDIIRRKILEKVATFTTWSEFADQDTTTPETTDPEMVNNASDADSAGESKVIAKSVEGEEDIVDITMSDAAGGQKPSALAAQTSEQYPQLLKQFNDRRPKWMDPLEFLDPQFQNMFELSYFHEANTALPTGWQSVQEETKLPRLSSRQPKVVVSDTEMRSPASGSGPWDGSEESGGEEASTAQQPHVQTRMADESSDEDSDFPNVRNLPAKLNAQTLKSQVSARGKKKMKPHKTYGKGKKRFEKQQKAALAQQSPESVDPDETPSSEDGLLIRPGDGVVVDWNEAAFDVVFGGSSPNDMRGMKTWKSVTVLEDPAIEARKKQRQARRKNGITLDDCLAEFEKEEILSEQDTWYCPRCKEHRRASKKFDLWKTPDILVVHLKRFSSSGWRRDKIDILVDFPVEGLDLTQRVIDKENGKEEIYDLIAVDNHYGGLGGGHYTAYARNFVDGEWYEYNDATVRRPEDVSRVVSPSAYLLFYRRRSEVPLGGPRFEAIFDRYDARFAADEDLTSDSGEGRRLGQGSSLRGSPSASTGADLTLPRGNHGLASGRPDRTAHSSASADTELPSYGASIGQGGEADDDTDMGGQLPWNQGTLRNSIEADGEDEGIDLPDFDNAGPGMSGITSVMGTSAWNFSMLPKTGPGSEAGGEDDLARSDVAQGNGSSDDDFFAAEGDDTEPMLLTEPNSVYIGTAEQQADFSAFDDPPAPVAQERSDYMTRCAVEAWEQQVHTVPVDLGDDQASEQVAEIHVGDENELPSVEDPPKSPKA